MQLFIITLTHCPIFGDHYKVFGYAKKDYLKVVLNGGLKKMGLSELLNA
jgi:hypothetical protein